MPDGATPEERLTDLTRCPGCRSECDTCEAKLTGSTACRTCGRWRIESNWVGSRAGTVFAQARTLPPVFGPNASRWVPAPEAELPPATEASSSPKTEGGALSADPVRPKGVKGKKVEARMRELCLSEASAAGWSADQWANRLGCSSSSVKGTKFWKNELEQFQDHSSGRLVGPAVPDVVLPHRPAQPDLQPRQNETGNALMAAKALIQVGQQTKMERSGLPRNGRRRKTN
jgi:hypothetical protein